MFLAQHASRILLMLSALALMPGEIVPAASERHDPVSSLTIKEIMRYAMTQGLCQRVVKGKASEDEQQQLVVYLRELSRREPPQGDVQQWRKQCGELIAAAEAIIAGRAEHQRLAKAANCVACHRQYRPK